MTKKVKRFNVSLDQNVKTCGCDSNKIPCDDNTYLDNTCNKTSGCETQKTCGPTWKEPLECIKFKGHEAKLPRGFISPNHRTTIEKMFKNWNDVDDPIFLEVNESYVDRLNLIYGGEGIFLGDPVSNKNLTLDEWNEKFPSNYRYNGILLLGIKMHGKRRGIYTS